MEFSTHAFRCIWITWGSATERKKERAQVLPLRASSPTPGPIYRLFTGSQRGRPMRNIVRTSYSIWSSFHWYTWKEMLNLLLSTGDMPKMPIEIPIGWEATTTQRNREDLLQDKVIGADPIAPGERREGTVNRLLIQEHIPFYHNFKRHFSVLPR